MNDRAVGISGCARVSSSDAHSLVTGQYMTGGCPAPASTWVLFPAGHAVHGQRVTETVGNDHPRSGGHSPKPPRGGPYLERVVEKVGAKVIP